MGYLIRKKNLSFKNKSTGGIITEFNNEWKIHTFKASGFFKCKTPLEIEYLIIGGGAGGGEYAGGGAGGFRTGSKIISAGNYIVTVGASTYNNGNPSSVFDITSAGGGRGAAPYGHLFFPAKLAEHGGCGGGGTSVAGFAEGGKGNTPSSEESQGCSGGNAVSNSEPINTGAGGGGAGTRGQSLTTNCCGGIGGSGRISNISGMRVMYCGGGGGGVGNSTSEGYAEGGHGGGGHGGGGPADSNDGIDGADGVANSGSGGGGAGSNFERNSWRKAGKGASGIVIIRYKLK